MHRARQFVLDDSGVESVETALVAGLIIAGLIALVGALGAWTFKRYKRVGRIVYNS